METNTVVEMEVEVDTVDMEASHTVDMEKKTTLEIPHPLNLDCLYKLFEWFGLKECMNFAEAYKDSQCVANHMYKTKFSEFSFDFKDATDRVFNHIGPFVRSLTLILYKIDYMEKQLKNICGKCEQLQSLTLKDFDRRKTQTNPFCGGTENLEVLTLNRCSLANDSDFFETFTNLKCLNIYQCRGIDAEALLKCFHINQMLKSFVCKGYYGFIPQLLTLLPNLERLCLQYTTAVTSQTFSNFYELRFLTLYCWGQNINEILTELAKKNKLEELVIFNAQMDGNTFNIINTFQKLERLVITTYTHEFTLPETLPPKLKSLKLEGFRIFPRRIKSLTKQLLHLEVILLVDCTIDNNGAAVRDFDSMADVIVQAAYNKSQPNRQLNIILTDFRDNLPTKIVEMGRLRICNYLDKSNVFLISYPGIASEEYDYEDEVD